MAATVWSGAVVPQVGQVVSLAGDASPIFRKRPILMIITEPCQPSSVDRAAGRPVDHAAWLWLTGWEIGTRGKRLQHRENLPVCAAGIVLVRRRSDAVGGRNHQPGLRQICLSHADRTSIGDRPSEPR